MIRHLVWDVGGTLFDTYPAVIDAAQAALAELGTTLPAEALRDLFRRSTRHALETLSVRLGVSEADLRERFRRAYDRVPPDAQPYFEGVPELCRLARARGGANFIVTHRERASVLALLDAHQLRAEFADIIAKEDPFPRKPDPSSLLALIERNGLSARECLMIGDRTLDVLAARGAGMRACLRSDVDQAASGHAVDGPASADGAGADLVVRDYAELLAWLWACPEAAERPHGA
ncbi:MAG TPA: HAD-IA family hydrolase [Polyangiaceae bacterium]|nr:HAD-IA family hydrolase [Polyangiaceae bacterium]